MHDAITEKMANSSKVLLSNTLFLSIFGPILLYERVSSELLNFLVLTHFDQVKI